MTYHLSLCKKNKVMRADLFGPDFLLPRAMKSDPIYRGWTRDILSLMISNLVS